MATARAFLAVPLPPALQQDIASLQTELSGALPGIRWTRPDTVHLTLHFFGDIRVDELEKIRASMLSVKLREKAFQVDVLGLGAFPDRRRPRVVWLGLTPEESLRSLQHACLEEVGRRGFPAEARAFAPHLTIGRFREHAPNLGELLAGQAERRIGRLPIGQLVLFESRLLPGGARHIPLFTVPLEGTIN
ncbi:MAG: RNA 2',3'-cyclic phosphodiesterase [Desulfuromonadales bacterium]|nr:RNA 2',3'-cyclic phosphodiesterase [Desulfuromonadales bacterium]